MLLLCGALEWWQGQSIRQKHSQDLDENVSLHVIYSDFCEEVRHVHLNISRG